MSTSLSSDVQSMLSRFGMYAAVVVVGSAVLFAGIGGVSGDDTPSAVGTQEPTASAAPSSNASPGAQSTPVDPPADPTDEPTGTTGSPTSEPTVDPTDEIPAGEVTVQILDGVLDGSGAAASVRDTLVEAGHELIAELPSSRVYEQTTVFWSVGYEDAANQIAQRYGWSVVRPGTEVGLSEAANVTVVVGQDAQ